MAKDLNKVVLHFDMDCFYCQVEARRLGVSMGAPLVVDQWGMLLSVNYPAKGIGISRKTPAREAAALGAIVAHVSVVDIETGEQFDDINSAYRERSLYKASLDRYRDASEEVMSVMKQVLPSSASFERASIDECYADIPVDALLELFPSLPDVSKLRWEGNVFNPDTDGILARGALLGERIRAEVLQATKFTASCGVSETRQVAKLSCALNKPDKLTVVSLSRTTEFMRTVPIKEIRGLGPRAMATVQQRLPWVTGLTRCGDLWTADLGSDDLARWLYDALRGLNDTPVKDTSLVAGSVQSSKQFRPGLPVGQVEGMLAALTTDMLTRLAGRQAKSLVVILQTGDTVRSRQERFPPLQDVPRIVRELAVKTGLLSTTTTFDRIAVTAKDVEEPAPVDKARKEVAEYLASSRLHFMGTWRTRYLHYMHEMEESANWGDGDISGEGVVGLKKFAEDFVVLPDLSDSTSLAGTFLLVDMDCFFCSVAMLINGIVDESVPCAVASGLGPTSEICSANYAARKFGVSASSFVSTAKELCPPIRVFAIDAPTLSRCEVIWKQVIRILCLLVGGPNRVQGKSCDEALVDLTGISGSDLDIIGKTVQRFVVAETGVPCSVGIAPSRILAKMATSKAKPKGVKIVSSIAQGADLLYGEQVKSLPGVGYSTQVKLRSIGVETVGDLLRERDRLPGLIGAGNARKLIATARGIDLEEEVLKEVSTVSAEKNFGLRNLTLAEATNLLEALSESVLKRCPPNSVIEKVVLKLKLAGDDWVEPTKKGGVGEVYDFSRTVNYAPCVGGMHMLLLQHLGQVEPTKIRGIGVSVRLKEPAATAGADRKRGRDLNTLDRWMGGEDSVPKEVKRVEPERAVKPSVIPEHLAEGPTDLCVVCGMEILMGSLTNHFLAAHSDGEEVAPCPICGEPIELKDSAHVASHFKFS